MKKSAALMLLSLTLAALSAAQANAADLKIGFVNTERVFRDSPLSVKAQKKLEKEFQGRDQDLQKLVKQARELQASLEKDGVTLSETDRSKKQKELAGLSRDIQHAQRSFREDYNLRLNEELGAVQSKARKAIQQLAEKEKFDLILENAVYVTPQIDITERVLKALEK